ncbi:hypothetical protein [Estrella lausannensis]|uniref:Uncharacterized protein n=1 Tax=Estrella lausannensis TaxID=483423 RepID=A0A0H5DPJ9_9BACT|nr:hypothetical protein [Estrella lausannensis]CRX38377.1 hypothetical protein ELAC_1032 [Estrella lausannensis]
MLAIGRIEIPRRGANCQICGNKFNKGDSLVSCLFQSGGASLVRVDACHGCSGQSAEAPPLSSWKSIMPGEKKVSMGSRQKDEAAKELFERLQQNPSGKEPSLYLLALYLERRKVLARRGEVEQEGLAFFLFEMPSSGETYSVPKVEAAAIDLASLDEEIKSIIGI